MIRKILKFIVSLFKKKPKPVVLTGVSESWIKSHLYDSGKDKQNDR